MLQKNELAPLINKAYTLLLVGLGLCTFSCATSSSIVPSPTVGSLYRDSLGFGTDFHAGFSLYDLQGDSLVYDYGGERFFIPASTTKLWTYYGAMHYFSDSIPVFEWTETEDTIYLRGVGSPVWLHSRLDDEAWIDTLLHKNKSIVYVPHERVAKFSPGWSWEDYPFSYQTERSTAPIYGNLSRIYWDEDSLVSSPQIPFDLDSSLTKSYHLSEDKQTLTLNPLEIHSTDTLQIPIRWSDNLVVNALSKELGQAIHSTPLDKTIAELDWQNFYSHQTDKMFKLLLHNSDNFIAEQLLLSIAYEKYRDFNTKQIIKELQIWAVNHAFANKWIDGSGLSRYNLFTPNHMTKLLSRMYREIDNAKLFDHLALGGFVEGISNYYSESPLISAKTGTLSGIHNLCGYFIGKRGKVYAFSLMNNHYLQHSSEVKKMMQQLLSRMRSELNL